MTDRQLIEARVQLGDAIGSADIAIDYEHDQVVLTQRDAIALVAELHAAHKAREALGILRGDLDADDLFAAAGHRLGGILRRWDGDAT